MGASVHKQSYPSTKLLTFLQASIYAIIILVPYYAFFTTWLSTLVGNLLFLRAWKEVLLLFLTGIVFYFCVKDKKLREVVKRDRFNWLAASFLVWSAVGALVLGKDLDAALLGLTLQLRPIIFFIVACTLVFYRNITETTLLKLVTLPAIGVVAFGILQLWILPYDFLKHFGYQKETTIPPYFTIDAQLSKIRIASTLRGPNPLGVYLVALIMTAVYSLQSNIKHHWRRAYLLTGLIAASVVLYGSQSRSAWLGLCVAMLIYAWLLLSKKKRQILILVAIILGAASTFGIVQYRNTTFVQDVIMHDNASTGGSISSNQGRIDAFKMSLEDIKQRPITGCGAGCAGPASVHNQDGANLSENFFIQTIQETGAVGFALLMSIFILVAYRLLKLKTAFSKLWFSIFIGVSVASLLSHAWADDTITYIWWGIAGLQLGYKKRKTTSQSSICFKPYALYLIL